MALQNSMGVATRLLAPTEAAALAPVLRTDDLLAAAYHARDGICSPDGVVQGYAAAARRLGATLLHGGRGHRHRGRRLAGSRRS